MYIKVRVDSPYVGTEQYCVFELEDGFNEWTEKQKEHLIDELVHEAVSEYVSTNYEILEGDAEDDPDW